MQSFSRRHLFGFVPGAAALALTAGCTTTKVDSTTTITINVAKITSYVDAAINGANTVLLIVKQIPALGDYVVSIQKIVTLIAASGYAFTSAVGDRLTVKYDDANVGSVVDSIFNVMGQLASLINDILTAMGKSVTDQSLIDRVQITYSAVKTLVSIIKAVISPSYTSANTVSHYTAEQKALKTLNA